MDNTMDILSFSDLIHNYSLDELLQLKAEYEQGVLNMVLDDMLILKLAIINATIEEREGK